MDSSDLTADQLRELHRVIGQYLGYLNRLRARMERVGFPNNDPLYRLVVDAAERMHSLSVELHYATCSGVGRKVSRRGQTSHIREWR